MIGFRSAAPHRIAVRSVGRLAEVTDVDPLSGLARHVVQVHPAGNLLAEIDPIPAFAELLYFLGPENFHHPVGRGSLRDQFSARGTARYGLFPRRIVEARRTPAGLLGSRVVMLARIDHIGQRPFGNPPCRIGRYHLLRPVLVDDMQLAEKPGRTVRPHPVNLRIVKAVAQHRADRVLAKAYPIGHVVAEVHDPIFPEIVLQRNRSPVQVRPLAVIRLIGDEHVVADFLPVHVQFEITESRPVKTGRSHRLIRTECLAQQRGARRNLPAGIRQRLVALPRSSDPLTLPVGLVEQSHMPYGRLAPFGNAAAIVPDADLPPAALARAQGTAAVGNQDRTVVLHLTAVPQIGLAGQQSLLGRRHPDLPSLLTRAPAAGHRFVDPRQPRVLGIHDRRIGPVFACQLARNDIRARGDSRRRNRP